VQDVTKVSAKGMAGAPPRLNAPLYMVAYIDLAKFIDTVLGNVLVIKVKFDASN